jgi:hypothetical protein
MIHKLNPWLPSITAWTIAALMAVGFYDEIAAILNLLVKITEIQ